MNFPDDTSLERQLARMRPAAPSGQLLARLVETCPATPAHDPRTAHWFARFRLPLAAAACVAIGAIIFATWHPQKQTPIPVARAQIFTPIEAKSELVSARELGVFAVSGVKPFRLIKTVWRENEISRAVDGAQLRITQMRSEFVPVTIETY